VTGGVFGAAWQLRKEHERELDSQHAKYKAALQEQRNKAREEVRRCLRPCAWACT
jgi:F0F1-type ATP synthase membrane subunit b/b'